ncbi:MAG TPA: FecR domain-containing protein [Opitutaceae bacterium]|nr:FecR domain-containing protein [Opitutaceae bacterium]
MRPRNSPFDRGSDKDRIDEAAAEWIGRCDGGLTEVERDELKAWRAADPRHEAAFARLELASALFEPVYAFRPEGRTRPDPNLSLSSPPRQHHPEAVRSLFWHWAKLPAVCGVAAALMLGLFLFWEPRVEGDRFVQRVATDVGGLQRVALPDGSVLELNTASAVDVNFDPKNRHITLVRGEVHFSVAKDPTRPFVVSARGVRVSAVGTAFNVRLRSDDIDVLVTEGRIRLDDAQRGRSVLPVPSADQEPPVLSAGHRAVVPVAALEANEPGLTVHVEVVPELEMTRLLAWQAKRLEFAPTSLREIVDEFNRYNTHQLVLADTDVAAINVGGSFAVGDYDMLVRLLEVSFGVAAERHGDRTVLRMKR